MEHEMHPRINRVVVDADGAGAQVSGPINWDPDERSATFSAAISQVESSGGIVMASGKSPHVFTPADKRWTAHVSVAGAGRLAAGAGAGWGFASVAENGGFTPYPWQVKTLSFILGA